MSREFRPVRNPSPAEVRKIVEASAHQAARRLLDPRTGDVWYWPFEQATHAEAARQLLIPYERPPGEGDVVTLDP